MFPLYTSVYDNSWSAMTWTVVFTGFVLYVTILMVAFVSLVHHASEATKPKETQPPARPRLPATGAGSAFIVTTSLLTSDIRLSGHAAPGPSVRVDWVAPGRLR